MSLQAVRNRYVQDAVATVSPTKLVTMLYDALAKDLDLAERAVADRNLQVVNERLLHAQDIILELQAGLDVTKWDGAPALMSLYRFFHRELVTANVRKDGAKVIAVRKMIEPLREAWHQAAAATNAA